MKYQVYKYCNKTWAVYTPGKKLYKYGSEKFALMAAKSMAKKTNSMVQVIVDVEHYNQEMVYKLSIGGLK